MGSITLKVPDDLHIKIKQMQLDLASEGKKITLGDLYVKLIAERLESEKK